MWRQILKWGYQSSDPTPRPRHCHPPHLVLDSSFLINHLSLSLIHKAVVETHPQYISPHTYH